MRIIKITNFNYLCTIIEHIIRIIPLVLFKEEVNIYVRVQKYIVNLN
jgi:hypothetical protein